MQNPFNIYEGDKKDVKYFLANFLFHEKERIELVSSMVAQVGSVVIAAISFLVIAQFTFDAIAISINTPRKFIVMLIGSIFPIFSILIAYYMRRFFRERLKLLAEATVTIIQIEDLIGLLEPFPDEIDKYRKVFKDSKSLIPKRYVQEEFSKKYCSSDDYIKHYINLPKESKSFLFSNSVSVWTFMMKILIFISCTFLAIQLFIIFIMLY